MPGVLIVEALAQVGAVAILSEEGNKGQDGIFRGNQQRKIQEKGSSGRQVKAGVPYHQEKRTGRHREVRRQPSMASWLFPQS